MYTPREDNEDLKDQNIWDLVGCTPVILSLRQVIEQFTEWPATQDYFELIAILGRAERTTYERLARKEDAPSVLAASAVMGTESPERVRTGMSVRFTDAEENAPDPTRI